METISYQERTGTPIEKRKTIGYQKSPERPAQSWRDLGKPAGTSYIGRPWPSETRKDLGEQQGLEKLQPHMLYVWLPCLTARLICCCRCEARLRSRAHEDMVECG